MVGVTSIVNPAKKSAGGRRTSAQSNQTMNQIQDVAGPAENFKTVGSGSIKVTKTILKSGSIKNIWHGQVLKRDSQNSGSRSPFDMPTSAWVKIFQN